MYQKSIYHCFFLELIQIKVIQESGFFSKLFTILKKQFLLFSICCTQPFSCYVLLVYQSLLFVSLLWTIQNLSLFLLQNKTNDCFSRIETKPCQLVVHCRLFWCDMIEMKINLLKLHDIMHLLVSDSITLKLIYDMETK